MLKLIKWGNVRHSVGQDEGQACSVRENPKVKSSVPSPNCQTLIRQISLLAPSVDVKSRLSFKADIAKIDSQQASIS